MKEYIDKGRNGKRKFQMSEKKPSMNEKFIDKKINVWSNKFIENRTNSQI